MTEDSDSALLESPTKYVEWKINNFFDLPTKQNYILNSSDFSLSTAEWYLGVYPNGDERDDSVGWIDLYWFKNKSEVDYLVVYRIGIKTDDGSEFNVSNEQTFRKASDGGYGKCKLVKRSVLLCAKDTLAPDGTLTIFCNLRICEQRPLASKVEVASQASGTSNLEAESQTPSSNGTVSLSANLKDMYLRKRLTDVTISVKSREFLAHKCILASRSSVLASMFENDMAETRSGRIDIEDSDPDSFEDFLLFLYTGELNIDLPYDAVSLYNISDKYDVQELKDICKERMALDLSIDSFCDVLRLATMHNELNLLKAATDFFIDNAANILTTSKWSIFLEENPALGNELFLKVLNNMGAK